MSAHPSPHQSFQPETKPIEPVSATERIKVIDILRGFALFGVLLINMRNFDWPGQVWFGTADRAALWLVLLFGDSKFWTIFSFLFGLGFALQLERARLRGAHFVRLYARRLSVLLLFGLLHLLIYPGDILWDYAIAGFLLLLVQAWSNRAILVLMAICYLVPIGYHAVEVRRAELRRLNPQATQAFEQRQAEERREDEANARLVSTGGLAQVLAFHARHIVPWRLNPRRYFLAYGVVVGGPLPLFLLGMLIGRRRVFQNIRQYLPFLRKALCWSVPLGIACTLISLTGKWPDAQLPYETRSWRGLLWYVGTPALSFSYAAIVILLAQSETWRSRLAPLAALGRTALSNYLLQSVIFSTLFYGYGLRLLGRVGPSVDIALTVLIFGLQMPLSVWWLRHFRFGPAEWLWRTLTYGKIQPMRALSRGA